MDGNTALMWTVERKNVGIINLLLNQPGIDIKAENNNGETALNIAENIKYGRGIARIIRSKMGPQSQQLESFKEEIKYQSMGKIYKEYWKAITQVDINEIDSWLDEEDKILVYINMKNKKRDTSLIIASENGNWSVIKWLLKYNANISFKDKNGDNALIRAAKKGHLDVVDELLFRKANINSTGQHKRTALMAAAESGHIRVVKLLIKKGAKVSVKDDYNKTVLDIVNEKIKKYANVNSNYRLIKNALKTVLESHNKHLNLLFNGKMKMKALLNTWEVVTNINYESDLKGWKKDDPNTYEKIQQLTEDIKNDPFRGLGQPERLMGDLAGLYSRKINKQDRLVYEIDGDKVILKSCK